MSITICIYFFLITFREMGLSVGCKRQIEVIFYSMGHNHLYTTQTTPHVETLLMHACIHSFSLNSYFAIFSALLTHGMEMTVCTYFHQLHELLTKYWVYPACSFFALEGKFVGNYVSQCMCLLSCRYGEQVMAGDYLNFYG